MKKLLVALTILLAPASALAQSTPFPVFGLDLTANNSQALSATGHLRLRYNSATGFLEVSVATGAYDTVLSATNTVTGITNKTFTSPTFNSATWNGTVSGTLMKPQRIANNSGTPAISTPPPNVQFGASPSASMSGGDVGGSLTLTTGTGPTAFAAATAVALGTITWNTTFSAAPKSVPLHPCNTNAADLVGNVTAYTDVATCTTTQCTVKMVGATVALTPTLAASTAYQYCYTVIQ